ncbi:hypothetical protein GCM10022226_03210 [Sphaerisporangium flaviroseum]|uniref:HTH cro/C1-type domain-containing protein n=1 Tax=Sphaerisporangium flaviroseum TaxID=509199 RepID=A0ABP7H841_9ACTN
MVNGIGNTSRSRRQRPLSDDLPEPTRVLLQELRALKERAGFDLRALEQATHASRSSWGRWLAGETWIPLDAVEGLARLCRADQNRFRELWEAAEQARRAAGVAETGERIREESTEVAETGERIRQEAAGGRAGERIQEETMEELPGHTAPRGPTGRLRRRVLIGAALGLSVGVGMVAGAVLGGSALGSRAGGDTRTAGPTLQSGAGGATRPVRPVATIDRATVIARARSWRPTTAQRVPYSQFKSHAGYRTDGSGYASMALGLAKPGPNTISLASPDYSRRVKMTELLQGDLVIDPLGGNTARAVVIFDKWADAGRTSYWAYQQRAGYGTDHRVVKHGLKPGDQFRAYRPINIRGPAQITPAPR